MLLGEDAARLDAGGDAVGCVLDGEDLRGGVGGDGDDGHLIEAQGAQLVGRGVVVEDDVAGVQDVERETHFGDAAALDEAVDLDGGGVVHVELAVDEEAGAVVLSRQDAADVGEGVLHVVAPQDGDRVA